MKRIGSPTREDATHCLVQTVAQAFAEEPSLEAVKLDRGQHSVSVATLGRPDAAEIERALTARIERTQQPEAGRRCGLLDGSSDCSTCPTPLPPDTTNKLIVRHD